MASPTRSRPVIKPMLPASPQLICPNSRCPAETACSGQISIQPPQPWHISGKVRTTSPMTAMALNWQSSEQARQRLHRASSTTGTMR